MLFAGMEPRPGGRRDEPPARALAGSLRALGLRLGRLKTGTPPRLRASSVDVSALTPQPGDEPPPRFSFFEDAPVYNRELCYLTRTNEETHRAIAAVLDRSPLYGGLIRGVGPRHCPSIEDKVVRFPERASHPIFIEPEGPGAALLYPNGISSSLPPDDQLRFVRTIRGLEDAEIVHPGYAVEYDFLLTSQIDTTLAVRGVAGLYAAGQLNGTSGYEEAAAQGLWAALNIRAKLEGRPPVVLRRDQAYLGVLVDDLVTKTPSEPYRMFTSQSEHRLILRQDNADQRLSEIGWRLGLLDAADWRRVEERRARVDDVQRWLSATRLDRERLGRMRERRAEAGSARSFAASDAGRTLAEVLRRPGVSFDAVDTTGSPHPLSPEDRDTLEADIKYDGYARRLRKEAEERRLQEEEAIPPALLDDPPESLSSEARRMIRDRRPRTLGQASRIPGVTPCDIFILAIRARSLAARGEDGLEGASCHPVAR
jgi:tRNA uridine 5-carboxymethylaminomethyl modification enzyme